MEIPVGEETVLAQPTRARLFARLTDLRRSADTEELARDLGLHPNGVRVHLDRLHAAGLVVRERERRARGRPRDRWSVSPTATPGGERPSDYANLGRLLVRAIVLSNVPVEDVEAAGRRIGRDLAPAGAPGTPEELMHGVLAASGFRPARRRGAGDRLTYCLGNCPYREVVRERQPVVCALHRGMTRGLLDVLDPDTTLTGFVPKDPQTAGCEIELHGPMAAQAASDG